MTPGLRFVLACGLWATAASSVWAQAPPLSPQPATQSDLDRSVAAWRAVAPRDYTITLLVSAHHRGSGVAFTFRVTDGEARLVSLAPDEAVETFYRQHGTIEQLFALIQDALSTRADRLDVAFHPVLGYPIYIRLDPRLNRMHDERLVQVLDLQSDLSLPGGGVPRVVSPPGTVRPPRRVPIPAHVSTFQPAMLPDDEGGRCETAVAHGEGQHSFTYSFGPPQRPTRRIGVSVENGRVVSYHDNRGDVRAPTDDSISAADPPGPRTVIMLDWNRQRATLANLEADGYPVQEVRASGPDVLTAPNLGIPAELAEMVIRACSPR